LDRAARSEEKGRRTARGLKKRDSATHPERRRASLLEDDAAARERWNQKIPKQTERGREKEGIRERRIKDGEKQIENDTKKKTRKERD